MKTDKISCPHCKQTLEYELDMCGTVVECPACYGELVIPSKKRFKKILVKVKSWTQRCVKQYKKVVEFCGTAQREYAVSLEKDVSLPKVNCQHCGHNMIQTTKIHSDIGLQVVGLLLFIVGICLLIVIPIGTVIGIILMIVSARMGYGSKKVWGCTNCGYFFERA